MSQIVRSIHGRRTSSGGAGCGGEGKESRIYYDDFLSLASHTVREQSRFFEAGDVIFRTGDEPDFMYLILEGRVRRTTPPTTRGASPAQWLQHEQYLSPGDYFGSSALLGSRTRHSTMTVASPPAPSPPPLLRTPPPPPLRATRRRRALSVAGGDRRPPRHRRKGRLRGLLLDTS